jgi:hypothetical protein
MAGSTIVAIFNEYAAAQRALCELIQIGIPPNCISIIAGDRSNIQGNRDLGIILERGAERYRRAVRSGRTILAVEADEAARTQVWEIIEHHMPTEIEEVAAAE